MRATHSKKVGTGSNKRPEKLNVHIRNSWRTNLQLIRSIGNMIGYKKSLSEWQCLSEVKMGRGSPIPPMLRRKIVEQYQKGVSQRKIAKSLKLSSSTVHNIIQRFKESGTISVRKGQGRKTILDARDLRALRRHCITCIRNERRRNYYSGCSIVVATCAMSWRRWKRNYFVWAYKWGYN